MHKRTTKLFPKHRYNWRPDLPDQRDFLFALKAPPKERAATLPASCDLRAQCSPVVNQWQIGSCTGNALAGAVEFLELAELRDPIDDRTQTEVFEKSFAPLSRLFIYYNERVLEGHASQDSGAQLRDGIKTLAAQGICEEKIWKYAKTNVLKKPNAAAYKGALPHCIASYLRLQSLQDMKQCLAAGFPFALGFTVYESFESAAVARTGQMPMPAPDERVLGGHAVLAVGYDDNAQRLIIRNSWGAAWGLKGYFTMPYAYAASKLATDFWTIRK